MEISEILHGIAFYFLAAVMLGGAVIVVRSRNLVYSAFSLLFTFTGVAGLYILAFADFVAIVQLLVYVGGILVLFLFGMMLTRKVGQARISNELSGTIMSHVIPVVVTGVLVGVVLTVDWTKPQSKNVNQWMGEAPTSIWASEGPDTREKMLENVRYPASQFRGENERGNVPEAPSESQNTGKEKKNREEKSTIHVIGNAFMGEYLLVFEEIALLLLVALLGACYLARRPTEEELETARELMEEEGLS